jgi:Thioesterase-like superfamily
VADAFYVVEGERFVPTELTRGPWDPQGQHAGPPSALIGRAIEACPPGGGHVGRITFEIVRSVPLEPLELSVRVVRPGRSVELLEASLQADGVEVMRASAWRFRTAAAAAPSPEQRDPPPPGPDRGEAKPFFDTGQEVGYHTAMDVRFVEGSFLELGPATVWMRMRRPLVAGEEPSPLQRVLCAADSGNGVSAALDYQRYLFINTDLSVHLHRLPTSDWVCLEAVTRWEPDGVGLSDTALWDELGRIGRGVQTLLVRER